LGIFRRANSDTVNTCYLWEIYTLADPDYSGRVTVPVSGIKETATIVNNESSERIRMFDTQFNALEKRTFIRRFDEQWLIYIEAIYQPINNGAYRAVANGRFMKEQDGTI